MFHEMLRFLVFGDVVGKTGRRAVKKILPSLKKTYRPDLVIANVENLAHGSGVTPKTLAELEAAGVNIFTSGDHIFAKPDVEQIWQQTDSNLLRPANFGKHAPGSGEKLVNLATKPVLVVNLLGRVFIEDKFEDSDLELTNPFEEIEKILKKYSNIKDKIVLIDFHTEATSEQVAMGYFLDGRVSAVWGTHTHIPTADAQILEHGTGFITDVGMTGARDTVLGVERSVIINRFLNETNDRFDWPELDVAIVNALYLEVDPKTNLTKKIKLIRKQVKL